VFLVPCPLVDPVDLKGTPASCKPTSALPRVVLWLRDVPPPVAYLEFSELLVAGMQVYFTSDNAFDDDVLVHGLASFRRTQSHVKANLLFPFSWLKEHALHREARQELWFLASSLV